jgi:sortase B
MKNGTMFKDIVKFKNESYFNENRTAYIYTPNKTIELVTIAAFYDTADGSTRKNDFENQNELYSFVKEKISKCSYSKYPDFEYDKIYIFVTCSYEFDNARTFLYAVEVEK